MQNMALKENLELATRDTCLNGFWVRLTQGSHSLWKRDMFDCQGQEIEVCTQAGGKNKPFHIYTFNIHDYSYPQNVIVSKLGGVPYLYSARRGDGHVLRVWIEKEDER